MESLSEIESCISKQCDELAEIIESLKTVECPNIVANNLNCILLLFVNSREHIEFERKQFKDETIVSVQSSNRYIRIFYLEKTILTIF